jgi:hypothetical protein
MQRAGALNVPEMSQRSANVPAAISEFETNRCCPLERGHSYSHCNRMSGILGNDMMGRSIEPHLPI